MFSLLGLVDVGPEYYDSEEFMSTNSSEYYSSSPYSSDVEDVIVSTERDSLFGDVLESSFDDIDDGNIFLSVSCGQKLEDIILQLEKIIVHGDEEQKPSESPRTPLMQHLDRAAHLAMLGQSIIAYLSILDSNYVRRLTTRIISDTTLWLSRLFRFDDSSAYYHMDDREGLVRVCRLALNSKYDKFNFEGFNALYAKPPIIYISAASRPGLGQFVCSQLGLPLSSLCTVPCNTMFGSQHTMDIASLERLIKDDIASTKTPLIVIANVGTPMAGHTDNLSRLRTICDEHSLWLHVNGHNLATLSLSTVPSSVLAAKRVNSMTLHPGTWLGLPGSPAVTLYKTADPALSLAAGLMSSQPQERLCALPIWLGVQNLGYNGIVNRLTHAASLSQHLSQRLNSIGAINLTDTIGQPKKEGAGTLEGSRKEVHSNTVQVFTQADTVSPVVVFKFDDSRGDDAPASTGEEETTETDSGEATDDGRLPIKLMDSFNRWLCDELNRRVSKVSLELVEGDQEGVCLKFSPLETAPYNGTTSEDIDHLVENLKDILSDLDFTIKQRSMFRDLVEAQENICYVDAESHAGLGAMQFIPDYLKKEDSEAGRKELNSVNSDIIQRLQLSHETLSLVALRAEEDTIAVGVGVVKPETNMEEIIEGAWTIGKELEDSSKFLESMSEIIRKGIQEAERELQKEEENRLIEEGVLRQIPLMSAFVNWWSPPPKEAVIKGRTLNLSSGQLVSTEDTYNLKMQLYKDSDGTTSSQTPQETPQETPLTSGDEAGDVGGEADTEAETNLEDTTGDESEAPVSNGSVKTVEGPKSILKKKDLEGDPPGQEGGEVPQQMGTSETTREELEAPPTDQTAQAAQGESDLK